MQRITLVSSTAATVAAVLLTGCADDSVPECPNGQPAVWVAADQTSQPEGWYCLDESGGIDFKVKLKAPKKSGTDKTGKTGKTSTGKTSMQKPAPAAPRVNTRK